MYIRQRILSLTAATLLSAAGAASAAPVDVTFTVTGTSGDWTLDFDVANSLANQDTSRRDQSLYFFGVALDGGSVAGGPASFNSTQYPTWTNAGSGGSATSYTSTWYGDGHVDFPGETLNGFLVHSDALVAPTSVDWFAYFSGSEYLAGGNFNNTFNPGFEGVAVAVPEPANVALLLAGFGLIGVMAKRRTGRG